MKLMQGSFEKALETLTPPVSCIISDGFMAFTVESAQRFGVPRLVFFGMAAFPATMYQVLGRERPHAAAESADEAFPMPGFPGVELTRNDFSPPFNEVAPSGPHVEFMAEQIASMAMSHGMIVNSFYEMEKRYIDFWDEKVGPKSYCVGPLCVAAPPAAAAEEKAFYVRFLDGKVAEGKRVLYVAFGTQAEVSPEQFRAIAEGLERSEVDFLWVLKPENVQNFPEFEERVKERGILVRGWVDQLEILKHEAVSGFLSHCGWNSAVESITAGVPILALPFMAEQHLNARFVVEELGAGLRLMPESGSVRGFVAAEEVETKARELMRGERGAEARRKMAAWGVAARAAMKEGGSSAATLDSLISEMSGKNLSVSSSSVSKSLS